MVRILNFKPTSTLDGAWQRCDGDQMFLLMTINRVAVVLTIHWSGLEHHLAISLHDILLGNKKYTRQMDLIIKWRRRQFRDVISNKLVNSMALARMDNSLNNLDKNYCILYWYYLWCILEIAIKIYRWV